MQQQVRAQHRRNNWYGIAAFIALLALVAGGIVLYNVLSKDEKAASVAVPDVVGKPLDEATKMLEDAGLAFNKFEEPTPDAVEGAVVRTDPIATTVVPNGTAIDVFYNPIKAPVAIPDVKGKSIDEATSILTGQGFTVVAANTIFVADSTIEPNRVLSTNPPFGQSAVQGTEGVLTASRGPDQVSVPDVTGQAGDAAKAFLEAEPYTFKVTVTSEPNADVPANNVLRTDPAVNTPVAKGSSINLIVSAGPAKVRVPPVVGLTEAAARNQLTTRGLVPKVNYVILATGSPDDGHVISQSIPTTESVLPGTTIVLQVGQAAPAPTTTTTTTTLPPATTTTSPPTADLAINVSHTSATASSVVYKVVISNSGPSGVTSARITDNMPSGLSGASWTCAATGGASCPSSGSGSGDIDATINVTVGGTVTFTITGTSSSGTTLTNTATIAVPNGVSDPTASNNTASDTVTIP